MSGRYMVSKQNTIVVITKYYPARGRNPQIHSFYTIVPERISYPVRGRKLLRPLGHLVYAVDTTYPSQGDGNYSTMYQSSASMIQPTPREGTVTEDRNHRRAKMIKAYLPRKGTETT